MSSYVSRLAVGDLVPLSLLTGCCSESTKIGPEGPAGTWILVPLIDLTSIPSLEVGSVHQRTRSVHDLPEPCWKRCMECSLVFVSFAPAARSRAVETRTESSIG